MTPTPFITIVNTIDIGDISNTLVIGLIILVIAILGIIYLTHEILRPRRE